MEVAYSCASINKIVVASEAGEYRLCVMLPRAALPNPKERSQKMVKTKVKFSAEFHRNQRTRKEKEKGIFDGDDNLVDGSTTVGNFHERAKQHEEYENALTHGNFEWCRWKLE